MSEVGLCVSSVIAVSFDREAKEKQLTCWYDLDYAVFIFTCFMVICSKQCNPMSLSKNLFSGKVLLAFMVLHIVV